MINKKDLDAVLIDIMARWDISGLAVGIVEGDNIVYPKDWTLPPFLHVEVFPRFEMVHSAIVEV
jgi:hypothetical protein